MIANSFDIFFHTTPHMPQRITQHCVHLTLAWQILEKDLILCIILNTISPTTTTECMSCVPHLLLGMVGVHELVLPIVFCNLFNIFPRASKYPDPEDVHTFGGSEYF
jgi:hypothetical protein